MRLLLHKRTLPVAVVVVAGVRVGDLVLLLVLRLRLGLLLLRELGLQGLQSSSRSSLQLRPLRRRRPSQWEGMSVYSKTAQRRLLLLLLLLELCLLQTSTMPTTVAAPGR